MTEPVVAILIPTFNEAPDLERCLRAISGQTLGADRMEVILVDGHSDDGTVDVASSFLCGQGYARSVIISNADRTTPSSLNLGLAAVTSPIVCRVDARSSIPEDYAARCVELLNDRDEIAVVGGAQTTVARDLTPKAIGIARALNNKWGMGLSRYRSSGSSGSTDTVYLGSFRTEDLRSVGGWDLRLTTNQDFDLNQRLRPLGLIWFDANLPVEYLARSSISGLFQQYRRFGGWKVRYWYLTGNWPRPRQMLLMVSPLICASALVVAIQRKPRSLRLAPLLLLPAAFVETLGSRGPAGGLRARCWSVCALASVAGGWLSGIFERLLHAGLD